MRPWLATIDLPAPWSRRVRVEAGPGNRWKVIGGGTDRELIEHWLRQEAVLLDDGGAYVPDDRFNHAVQLVHVYGRFTRMDFESKPGVVY